MNTLLKSALIGTTKLAQIPWQRDHDVDALVQDLPIPVEEKLLLAAGVHSLYEQAGQQGLSDIARLPLAPPATAALRSSRLVLLLQQAIEAENKPLLTEFLQALAIKKLQLPVELLPRVLDFSEPGLREQVQPVLGERGLWLSQFQPRWSWVSQEISSLTLQDEVALRLAWEEGKLAQRCVALRVIRQTEPARGRQWLEETLPQEKADARAQLVDSLSVGLSIDDEPLLERLLDDRSEQVKQVAAALLRQLPDSALSLRMRHRAIALLQLQGSLLRSHPPEQVTADWMRDGISVKTTAGRGKRAYWVESAMSAVPVAFWSSHFQMEPLQLVHALQDDDYAQDVMLGWTRSLQQYVDHTANTLKWAHALWNYWLASWQQEKKKSLETLNRLIVLLKMLPSTTAEQQLLPFLVQGRMHTDTLLMLLAALPRPWSVGFATQYLRLARQISQTGVVDEAYEWAKTLDIASRAIPKALFQAALAPWEPARLKGHSWTAKALEQLIEQFLSMVHLRQLFFEELADREKQKA